MTQKSKLNVLHVLQKIDTSSVLFFLGILMGVAALQEAGFLNILATSLRDSLGNIYSNQYRHRINIRYH